MQHEQSISKSFGPNAKMYLTSPVHSIGADLDWLSRAAAGLKRPTVLDIGCGAGHAAFAMAPFSQEVVAFDPTDSMLEVTAAAARERKLHNLSVKQGAAEDLPFDDARFDFIVSRYSAHHWVEVPRALSEVRRVLKPTGKVCFIDLAGAPSPLFDTHLQAVELVRDPSHVRSYTRREWLSLFQTAGFDGHVEQEWRLATDFSSWTSRIGSSSERVAAIKTIWSGAPTEVRDYFNLKEDCSFDAEALMVVAKIAP
jgi:ubiquinone/menaquinone biosynthesis C-methylase UbiE